MSFKPVFGLAMFCSVGLLSTAEARAEWSMYNHDAQGTRHNTHEYRLDPHNVGGLAIKWSFATPAPVSATPAAAGRHVYAGDFSGAFYSLQSKDGSLEWQAQAAAPVSASALVVDQRVIFGDLGGFIYGVDRKTGDIRWQIRPNSHPLAAIYGSGTPIGRYVAFGVASNEEDAAANPSYPCCSFRGSVLLLDPHDGRIVWQTSLISDADAALGASGVGVWSTPTYDPELDLIYVTTGNNYTKPTTAAGDAFVALDARTGKIVWVNQRVPDDTWNYRLGLPTSGNIDADIGDSPQVYTLPHGQRVVGAGGKSGFYYVVDAATGALVNQEQYQIGGGGLGGLFSDSAIANGVVFANSSEFPIKGDLIAFTGDAKRELWRFTTEGSPDISGVAVANGVVYFNSLNGSLYALDAESGSQLVTLAVNAGQSGPAVSNGHVYLGTGSALAEFEYGLKLPGGVMALGLPGDEDCDDNDDD